MIKITEGNPKDLTQDEYGNLYCPHCKEQLRVTQLDMGGNHSLHHLCRPKGGIRYQYSGRTFDLRNVKEKEQIS